jgi:hypothetical protein
MEVVMARELVFKNPADKARWLSQFLSTDMERIATSDFAKLSYEFFCFVQGEKTANLMGPGIYADTEGKREMFGLLQQEMSKILDLVVKWKKEGADCSPYHDPRLIPGAWDPEVKPKAQFNLKYAVHVYKDELWLEHDRYELIGPMFFSLFNLLSKFTLSSIKTCANEPCGKFFIQTTKREKLYCSQRCAWQQTARKTRRAGGDEYRKKQRKVMRKRYVENQKKKHGPNVKVKQRKK